MKRILIQVFVITSLFIFSLPPTYGKTESPHQEIQQNMQRLNSRYAEKYRIEAYRNLVSIGKPAISALLDGLDHKDLLVQSYSILALREINDKSAMPTLIKILNDVDRNIIIRLASAESLGMMNNKTGLELCLKIIRDKSYGIKEVAKIENSPALKLLWLDEWKYEYIRKYAVRVLEKIDKPAIPHLRELLKDEDPDIRESATIVLGRIGDSSIIPEVKEGLMDADRDVRLATATALGEIGDKSCVSLLINVLKEEKDKRICEAIITTLGKIGDESAIPALKEKANDSDQSVQNASIHALEKLGIPREEIERPLQSYALDVHRRIKENWSIPNVFLKDMGEDLEAIVVLKLKPNGELIDIRLQKHSGSHPFDESVLRAIKKTAPFPIPPFDSKEDLEIEIGFYSDQIG